MIKKFIMLASSAMLAGVLFTASSVDVKAALPCTYDIINDANAQIANAEAGYAAAKADENAKLATFNAVKADPAHSLLAYQTAAADYTNAVNVSQWWLAQVNNAKTYLKNISDRGAFEDKFWENRAAIENLTTLKASKFDLERATNIANGTAQQIANVEKALAGYQTMVASGYSSMQPQIDALNVKLNALRADYEKQAAQVNALNAAFENNLNTLNTNFDLNFDNYQHQREWQRDNEHFSLKEMRWMDYVDNTK